MPERNTNRNGDILPFEGDVDQNSDVYILISDQHILAELERRKIVVFTPSRRVGGKRVVCYDDRFIVKLAYDLDGIIVSNDTYRDLQSERLEWKRCIEERLLMYSFVNDKYVIKSFKYSYFPCCQCMYIDHIILLILKY